MKSNIKGHMDELKQESKTSNVSLGNLYDMNKQLMLNEPEMEADAICAARDELALYGFHHMGQSYFMLLCHEARDYTLFNLNAFDTTTDKEKSVNFATDVIECLQNRGILLAADKLPDGAWEFWIKAHDTNEACAYYLFPYGAAVLEY